MNGKFALWCTHGAYPVHSDYTVGTLYLNTNDVFEDSIAVSPDLDCGGTSITYALAYILYRF